MTVVDILSDPETVTRFPPITVGKLGYTYYAVDNRRVAAAKIACYYLGRELFLPVVLLADDEVRHHPHFDTVTEGVSIFVRDTGLMITAWGQVMVQEWQLEHCERWDRYMRRYAAHQFGMTVLYH